jgi:hypothetical protein
MLFDLRGKRRRAVQVTYLSLALLMGGGLIFFGIGGSVSGGLLDAFKGGGGGGGNGAIKKRIDRDQKRAAAGSEAALKELVRDYYQLATSQTSASDTSFPKSAQGDLQNAARYWQRYLSSTKNPDPSLARVAFQVYSVGALSKPKEAEAAIQLVAQASNDPSDYLQLVQYAALAGDTRTANLATIKAVDLAPKDQRKQVKLQADQLKKAATQTQTHGGG